MLLHYSRSAPSTREPVARRTGSIRNRRNRAGPEPSDDRPGHDGRSAELQADAMR
ncbi:MAG: hypothetical protein IIT36_01655 [Aeriscardovia sp.]|nr:hypothetical protein [Aeriscardovia sp.]